MRREPGRSSAAQGRSRAGGAVKASAPVDRRPLRNRRWCVPSTMLRAPGETLDGVRILDEQAGALGVLLWEGARDVELWAATPPEARPGLFVPAGAVALRGHLAAMEVPAPLAAPLDTLAALLATPGRTDEEVVSICCLEVAAWARAGGALHTATAYAQAAALAAPQFPEAALLTGRCALAAGQPERAETWLWRAVAVARRARDGSAYAAAYVLLGTLCEARGQDVRAGGYFLTAFRAGRRFAARVARRDAAHGLFRIARRRGDPGAAAQFALAAQRSYHRDQPGAANLLLDLARFWTDQEEPARARAALRRLVPRVAELSRADGLAAAALTARALASHSRDLSRQAEARAWALLDPGTADDEAACEAAVDLAHAAAVREDRPAYDRAARAALRLAPASAYARTRDRVAALGEQAFAPRKRGVDRVA
jgi:hypothetical protein